MNRALVGMARLAEGRKARPTAGNPATFRGFHALTVNNACRGLMIASVLLTRRSDQSVVDLRQ